MSPRRLLIAGLLALAALPAAAQLLPPGKALHGASQEAWARRWWQWALSFDEEDSPVADTDGHLCASGQSGPVWFLAGSFESRRTERRCRIPAGKTLFFPLANMLAVPPDDEREPCASLVQRAQEATDEPDALVLELNGRRFPGLAAHRQASKGCFLVTPDDDAPAAGNGYYVALGPLKPGRYTLHFGAILPNLSQAVTYTLDVK